MRRQLTLLLPAFLLLSIAPPATAHHNESEGVFSVLPCSGNHFNNDDPIVHPGVKGATHLHEYGGNLTTDFDSTYESMVQGGTDCPNAPDTAGYWFPALLDKAGNRVPPFQITAYYRDVPSNPALPPPEPYPPGLKIVAGAPTIEVGGTFAGFLCSDGPQGSSAHKPTVIDCSSGRMHGTVLFPQCLQNGAFDSPDHRSHMTYATWGGCPDGYVLVPRVSLTITWAVSEALSGGYRLSSDPAGAPPGSSLHADFWNTWDQRALERLNQECLVEHNRVPEAASTNGKPGCRQLMT
jgi:hypothetical protein